MESCARLVALLPEFAEESLPPEATGRVRSHLGSCEACRRRLVGHHRTLLALQSLPQVIAPEGLRTSIMDRVRRQPLRRQGAGPRHLYLVKAGFWAGIAALAASAVALGAAVLSRASWSSAYYAEPTLLTEWLIALGQAAFSLLVSVATRAEIPALLATPRNLLAWQGTSAGIVVVLLTGMLAGFGALATARLMSRRPSR